mgnify:CR=1 FL=1
MFYHYNQNNSGGSFDVDDKVCRHVIIEAPGPVSADLKAEEIGIYFNGCDSGLDCPCCGDRWSTAWRDDEEPLLYGQAIQDYGSAGLFSGPGEVYCRVYYADGLIAEHRVPEAEKPLLLTSD